MQGNKKSTGKKMSEMGGKYLRAFLQEKKISISECARVAGLSRHALYKYFNGANISGKSARKISDGLWRFLDTKIVIQKLLE